MISHNSVYQGYISTATKSAKDSEIEIILETTRRLRRANDTRNRDFPNFAAALQDNRKLWTILASDVASSGNGLPEDLRARIFFLGEFTQAFTRRALQDTLSVDPLIEINLAVLRGLSDKRNGS